MTTLTCFAIDDEPHALELTRNFIVRTPFLHYTGGSDRVADGLAALHANPVDLLFLDIEMPHTNGLELATMLNQQVVQNPPMIVFTTAFDHFAIDGFRVNAIDFLLKPFSYEEFLRAANRALRQVQLKSASMEHVASIDHLFVKVDYSLVRVDFKDILYIVGLKDYTKIFLKGASRPLLTLTSLKALEEKLPTHSFMRVHRSYIAGLNQISSITRTSLQIGDTTVPIGEQYKDVVRNFVDHRTP
ncbi:LytTR family DNA-binding domain-containing protein [Chryseolinea sp. T2]|uniref:LytR/AlgR family response regulator transcription factor n=1 Tax=Chryseolinea sp. T2 TaxID=3129255 RepID=UPI003077B959